MARISRLSLFCFLSLSFIACQRQPQSVSAEQILINDQEGLIRLDQAYRLRQSGVFVEARGVVVKILTDDLEGRRHQRMILRLENGQTLLIAHNIDIAPRIENLALGDEVIFSGIYEWNDLGGVVHWTHHDPSFKKRGGWIFYQGWLYQ